MARTVGFIQLRCADCENKWQYSREHLENWLDDEPTIMNTVSLYADFECPDCGSRRAYVYGDRNNLLIDPNALRICDRRNCQNPIPLPRLETFPEASTCPLCAAEKTPPPEIRWPFSPEGKEECPKCGKSTEVRRAKGGGNYFLGCSDFPNCWWHSQVREDDLRWSPSSRFHAPHSGEKQSDEVEERSVNLQVLTPPSVSEPYAHSARFVIPWELNGQLYSWTVKISQSDDIVEIADKDGLITEMPICTARLLVQHLSRRLSISTIANNADLDDTNLVEAAIERMVRGKTKPILQAMANSTHALSFGELMSLTDLSRPEIEGILGAITAVLRKTLGNKNVKLWVMRDGCYHLSKENLEIIKGVLE